jgi:hypothetical protein
MSTASTRLPQVDLGRWPDLDFTTVDVGDLVRVVVAADPRLLSKAEHLGLVAATEYLQRHLSALQAVSTSWFTQLAGPADGSFNRLTGVEIAAAELAVMKALTTNQAGHQARICDDLLTDLPGILDLVRAGKLDMARAGMISDLMHQSLRTDSWDWLTVAAIIASLAAGLTHGRLRQAVLRALAAVNPKDAEKRHREARDRRHVYTYPLPDGMGELTAVLTADQMQMIDAVLDALADACRDQAATHANVDTRSHQQRRADAMAAVFNAISTATPLPLIAPENPETRSPEDPETPYGSETNDGPGTATSPETPAGPPAAEPRSAGTSAGANADAAGGAFVPADSPLAPQPNEADGRSSSGFRGLLGWWLPPALPTQQGRMPHLVVTIAQSTLDGLDDMPGHLRGYGAIPASLARSIAAQATMSATMIIPTGAHPSETSATAHHPPSHSSPPEPSPPQPNPPDATGGSQATGAEPVWSFAGHSAGDQARCPHRDRRYKPRQSVIDEVVGLQPTCRFPGCDHSAERCDLDHVIEYANGGTSCACNLEPLCRTHHRLKTHGGWSARFTSPGEPFPAGTVEWRSPNGQRRYQPPVEVPGSNAWQAAPPPPSTHSGAEPKLVNVSDMGLYPDDATADERRDCRTERWAQEATDETGMPHKPSVVPDHGEPPF